MLETFLSGASFTDMLAVMSTQLDAAEQDRVLAQQIAQDRETLLALHKTVEETRAETNILRQETGVQKQKLDRRMEELRKQQAHLKALEKAAKAALAQGEGRTTPSSPRTRRSSSGRSPRRRRPARSSSAGSTSWSPGSSSTATSRRQYNGTPDLADGRVPSRSRFGCTGVLLGAAERRLRPLPQRHRHRGALRDAGPRVGRRPGRVLRLELRRRRRPGLDRDHRPLLEALPPGTPT